MNEDNFKLTQGFKGYINKPDVTTLAPNFLTRGSKNVLVDYAQRIVSRNGYVLFGVANTGLGAIKSSYDWETSTAKQFPLRTYDQYLEFYWNSTWNRLKTGLVTPYLEFAKIFDNTEKIDVLLWVLGDTNTYKWSGGASKVRSSTGTTLTKQGVIVDTTIAFVTGDGSTIAPTITDSNSNFVNAGFAAGDTLNIAGSTANNRNFTIASVVAGTITLIMSDVLATEAAGSSITLHNGEPTWASSRFLTAGTRKVVYNGTEYTYTGGEGTATLTGLTAFPAVSVGDVVWQAPITLANSGAFSASFKQDLIGVQLNQLILASTKSQEVYGSKNTDYTDFVLTTPRAPADPFKVNMDNYATCIVPIDNQTQTTSSLMFGGGTSEFFQLSFQLSQDNTSELVRMVKLKTANGSGLISKGAITPVKNATAYITREPSLDTLDKLESLNDNPLSDLVKNDFDSYNFANAHVKYWKRSIYIAVPVHGLVLIYDLQRKLWQPPQTIAISRFAIIGDWLYGHSSVSNESYKLFTGTDDNGVQITQVARFAYNNGGRRDRIKNASEYWSDGYITPNGKLNLNVYFGFDGSAGTKALTISGGDTTITTPVGGSPLGDEPLGATPIGGDLAGLTALGAGPTANMLRFYQADTMHATDYVEMFVEYAMNTLGGQFALVSHGSNQWDAGTAHITHKK